VQVREWFDTLARPKGATPLPERRTDVYLPTPGARNLSVKLSRGYLETKLQRDATDFRSASGKIQGVSERWIKWSWKYDDAAQSSVYRAFESQQRADWVELEKARGQRKFRVVNGAPEPILANARVELGYAIEIVDGLYRGVRWWSVGVDAFAPDDERIHAMLGDAVRLMEESFPLTLTRAHSMSYPAWVDRLISV
jgi:hypothetical protein